MFAIVKAFIAGFVSTLTFHQGLVWVFAHYDIAAFSAWNMAPVPPLEIPAVVSLALWGGVWGIILWFLIRRAMAAGYYVGATILGAIGPSAVALSLVAWLKDKPLAENLDLHVIGIALALNGAWGLGVAIFMRVMHPPR